MGHSRAIARRLSPCLDGLERRRLLSTGMMGLAAEVHKTTGARPVTVRAHTTGTFSEVPVSSTPPIFATTITGQGSAPGFGTVTALAHTTLTVAVHGKHKTAVLTGGTGTLTDAAGDQVFFTFGASGPFVSATKFKPSGQGIITGGTGDLAGVTGRLTASGTADAASGTFALNFVVKANYPGT